MAQLKTCQSSVILSSQDLCHEDSVDSNIINVNLTSFTLLDLSHKKIITLYMKCPTFELLNEVLHCPHVSIITESVANTIRQNYFMKIIGLKFGECRKKYSIIHDYKVVARITYDIHENTHSVLANNNYYWNIENILNEEKIELDPDTQNILDSFGIK
jgi:hypothetical protein